MKFLLLVSVSAIDAFVVPMVCPEARAVIGDWNCTVAKKKKPKTSLVRDLLTNVYVALRTDFCSKEKSNLKVYDFGVSGIRACSTGGRIMRNELRNTCTLCGRVS